MVVASSGLVAFRKFVKLSSALVMVIINTQSSNRHEGEWILLDLRSSEYVTPLEHTNITMYVMRRECFTVVAGWSEVMTCWVDE